VTEKENRPGRLGGEVGFSIPSITSRPRKSLRVQRGVGDACEAAQEAVGARQLEERFLAAAIADIGRDEHHLSARDQDEFQHGDVDTAHILDDARRPRHVGCGDDV
jgi:hypothetical protein